MEQLKLYCCGMCIPGLLIQHDDMVLIERALGNICHSHKAITFAGLVNTHFGKV